MTAAKYRCAALVLAAMLLLTGCGAKNPNPTQAATDSTQQETFPPVIFVTESTDPSGTENTDPTGDTTPSETTGGAELPLNAQGYPALTSKSGEVTTYDDGVFRVDNAAYEPYSFSSDAAQNYATVVNKVADSLAGTASVYCIPIPTSYGITLPDDIREKLNSYSDQGEAMQKIVALLDSNVKVVNSYENLMRHRNEYLYFRTDHHWTALGAYYSYETFCDVKGIAPVTPEQHKTVEFDNFLGSFYWNNSGEDDALEADTVIAYEPLCEDATMEFTDNKGDTYAWDIIMDVSNWASSSKYNTFCAGDNPYSVLTNPSITDGSSCVYIKESFGNALLPFLVEHYGTIYELDYRYWDGNVIDFVKEHGVKDVIFANNLSMIRSNYLIGSLAQIAE